MDTAGRAMRPLASVRRGAGATVVLAALLCAARGGFGAEFSPGSAPDRMPETCAGPAPLAADPGAVDLLSPPDPRAPTVVDLRLRVVDLSRIDVIAGRFGFSGYARATWCDPRQAFEPGESSSASRVFAGPQANEVFGRMWTPDFRLANSIGATEVAKRVISIRPDGLVSLEALFTATLSARFDLREFPIDHHVLEVPVQSFSWDSDTLKLRAPPDGVNLGDSVALAEWSIDGIGARTDSDASLRGDVPVSRLVFDVEIARRWGFYIVKVGFPLAVIVALTWSVFWMKDEPMAGRIRIASTGVLTIVAYQFAIASSLPRVSYLTLLDRAMIVSFLLIAVTVIESIVVDRCRESDGERAQRIDRRARWMFPLVYVALLALAAGTPHLM